MGANSFFYEMTPLYMEGNNEMTELLPLPIHLSRSCAVGLILSVNHFLLQQPLSTYSPCCCNYVVLRQGKTAVVMLERSVNLTTLFLGQFRPPKQLTSTSCTRFF